MRPNIAATADTLIHRLRQRTTYLSCAEVMSLLGKSRNTLCRWVRDGIIPGFKFGKDYRFAPLTLAGWIEAHQL
jgi:excisionase family DNA binding protein